MDDPARLKTLIEGVNRLSEHFDKDVIFSHPSANEEAAQRTHP